MKSWLIFLCFLGVVFGNRISYNERNLHANPVKPSKGSPWPHPQSMTTTDFQMSVDAEMFQFVLAAPERCDDIQSAFIRYKELTFGRDSSLLKFRPLVQRSRSSVVIDRLQVSVLSACEIGALPSLESDESYKLVIEPSGAAYLNAGEVWGALRGLETFSQLVYRKGNGEFAVNETNITDFPRFKHRGLLFDTSRHFLSVKVLKDNLDIMAQNKFNIFHWHIVDDQSFPYESYTFPEMSIKGAYSPVRHIYSQNDIKELIEYARQRGIRVIPEFDSPGHTQSWGKAIPDLLTKCYTGAAPNGEFGPINPALNSTYIFLSQFFKEIASVFPDKYVNLGGDEVSFDCWKSNPDVTGFMKRMGFFTDYSLLEQYYLRRVLEIAEKLQKSYIIWQEVVDNGVKVAQDTVVDVWKTPYEPELARITGKGYKTLLSACWYLDLIAYGPQWKQYYLCDPQLFNGTEAQRDLVMGGEAAIWGEYVDDTNLVSRLWPRASAAAERLWSASSVTDIEAAASRIEELRCRLVGRGYPAEPPNGPSFCEEEYV